MLIENIWVLGFYKKVVGWFPKHYEIDDLKTIINRNALRFGFALEDWDSRVWKFLLETDCVKVITKLMWGRRCMLKRLNVVWHMIGVNDCSLGSNLYNGLSKKKWNENKLSKSYDWEGLIILSFIPRVVHQSQNWSP